MTKSKYPTITTSQLLFLFLGSAILSPYTFLPSLKAPPANQDVWITFILSMAYSIILSLPLLYLTNKFRGMHLNDISENTLGKILGKSVCIVFAIFFLFICFLYSLMVINFIITYLFPTTPAWAIDLYGFIPITYAVYKGAGVTGKLATFIVPYTLLTIVVFFIMGADQFQLGIIRPVLTDSSIWDLNWGAFLTGARVTDIFIFAVFSIFFEKKININKTFFKSIGIFLIFALLILIPTVLTLGLDVAQHSWNPYFLYTRFVKIYDFITRVESFNTLAWFLSVMLKVAIYNYMACQVLSKTFNQDSHKKFVIPIAAALFCLCSIPIFVNSSTLEFLRSDSFYPALCIICVFIIPLIIVITHFIKQAMAKSNQKT